MATCTSAAVSDDFACAAMASATADDDNLLFRGRRLARRGADLGRSDAVALVSSAHALAHIVGDIKTGIALVDHALQLNVNLAVA